jgi:hypothetical protein
VNIVEQKQVLLSSKKAAEKTKLDNRGLVHLAATELRRVLGLETAFIDGAHIYSVAKEHRDVDWAALIEAEDKITQRCPDAQISVRAHQGRDPSGMFPQLRRIF